MARCAAHHVRTYLHAAHGLGRAHIPAFFMHSCLHYLLCHSSLLPLLSTLFILCGCWPSSAHPPHIPTPDLSPFTIGHMPLISWPSQHDGLQQTKYNLPATKPCKKRALFRRLGSPPILTPGSLPPACILPPPFPPPSPPPFLPSGIRAVALQGAALRSCGSATTSARTTTSPSPWPTTAPLPSCPSTASTPGTTVSVAALHCTALVRFCLANGAGR